MNADEAADQTISIVRVIVEQYLKAFSVSCPVTGGYDSRMVLGLLQMIAPNLPCYTIRHHGVSENNPDLSVPRRIFADYREHYRVFEDVELPQDVTDWLDAVLGKGNYSQRTALIAHTIRTNLADHAIVNGDIAGQVGKVSLHRNIPNWLMGIRYYRCKLHNYSHSCLRVLNEWFRDANGQSNTEVCDLFSIENRLGRWAAQENQIYDLLGVPYLNIFNCRRLIAAWTSVPRSQRKMTAIHQAVLLKVAPELLSFGFPASLSARMAKKTDLIYWISSFVKFYYERTVFLVKGRA